MQNQISNHKFTNTLLQPRLVYFFTLFVLQFFRQISRAGRCKIKNEGTNNCTTSLIEQV